MAMYHGYVHVVDGQLTPCGNLLLDSVALIFIFQLIKCCLLLVYF